MRFLWFTYLTTEKFFTKRHGEIILLSASQLSELFPKCTFPDFPQQRIICVLIFFYSLIWMVCLLLYCFVLLQHGSCNIVIVTLLFSRFIFLKGIQKFFFSFLWHFSAKLMILVCPCSSSRTPTSGTAVTFKTGRREVPGSNPGRACRPSRSEFSVVFSEIRINTG